MSRTTIVVVAMLGALAILAVASALDALTVGGVLTVVWAAAWLYRFWELR